MKTKNHDVLAAFVMTLCSGCNSNVPAGPVDTGGSAGPDAKMPCATVAVDTTLGSWRTAMDPTTCRLHLVSDKDQPAVLHGVSMTGLETGTRETASGGGFWLFNSATTDEPTNAPIVLGNVIDTLISHWKPHVVRIPICSSAWAQDYTVKNYSNVAIKGYRNWVDLAIQKARATGAVVIIDNHLWAIAKMGKGTTVDRGTFTSNGATHNYSDYEDGCTGVNKVGTTDSCAPQDFGGDTTTWECPIANADGVSLYNAYYLSLIHI